MMEMLPAIKERFQRFQIVYHIRVLGRHQHCLLGGFHIEEAVYGPRYYYPGMSVEVRQYEPELPDDVILVHLHARPEVIRQRMEIAPHPQPLVPSSDVDEILQRFREEVQQSWIHRPSNCWPPSSRRWSPTHVGAVLLEQAWVLTKVKTDEGVIVSAKPIPPPLPLAQLPANAREQRIASGHHVAAVPARLNPLNSDTRRPHNLFGVLIHPHANV